MEIKMYDVGFGEAIVYEADGEQLLVDCGSRYFKEGDQTFEALEKELSFGNLDVLITHFDVDHYNGLIEMAKNDRKVRCLYLPKYIVSKADSECNYLKDQMMALSYFHVLGKKQRFENLTELFIHIPELTDSVAKIKCVGCGDIIELGRTKLDILWPDVGKSNLFPAISCKLKELLDKSIKDNKSRELHKTIENLVQVMMDFYFVGVIDEKDKTDEINPSNPLQQNLSDRRLMEYDYLNHKKRILSAKQKLEEVEKRIQIEISSEMKTDIESNYKKLIRSQNDSSVIFSRGEDILALGDASKKIVRHLVKEKRIAKHYTYLKAPHHGTNRYYADELPEADHVFISNSGKKQVKWKISDKYPERYQNAVQCTNTEEGRCMWIEEKVKNCVNRKNCMNSTNCNVFRTSQINPVCITIP